MFADVGEIGGRQVREALLESPGVEVRILSYGAITRDWRVDEMPMVMGFEDIGVYDGRSASAGAICGRVANRTSGARFTLDGETYTLEANEGPNNLHGGTVGLSRQHWNMETDTANNAVQLTYTSPDGEGGFPGKVEFEVVIRLDGHRLHYTMRGLPDRPTPINLAQHSYYNLNGGGEVLDHRLTIPARRFTELDAAKIPTGRRLDVSGTRYDFRDGAVMGAIDPAREGIDINLILDEDRDVAAPAVIAEAPGGRLLKLWTNEPGMQLYNAPKLAIPDAGWFATGQGPFCGICFEAQHFPDALNRPEFPSIIATPERPYIQKLSVEIS